MYRILTVSLDIHRPVARPVPAPDNAEKKPKIFILVFFNIFRYGDLSLRVTEGRTHNDLAGYR